MWWLFGLAGLGAGVLCLASCMSPRCDKVDQLECPKEDVAAWCHGGGLDAGDCALENTETLCPSLPCTGNGIVFGADPTEDQVYTESVYGLAQYTLEFAGYADDDIDPHTIAVGFDGAKATCELALLGLGDRFAFTCPIPPGAKLVTVRRSATGQPAPAFLLQVVATHACRMKETEVCGV